MSTPKATCLLIGAPPGQARMLRETLAAAPGRTIGLTHATRLSEGLALLGHGSFDVVFLDTPLIDAAPTDALARVVRFARGAGVVVLVRPVDEPDGRAALSAGAHSYVVKDPVWELDLPRLLRGLDGALAARRPSVPQVRRGTVVSVLGTAGGSGTTSTALRLARQLARSGASTVLIELRSWPGALVRMAGVRPAGHLGMVLGDAPAPLPKQLTSVTPALKLLLAPPTDRADHELTAERTTRLLDELTRLADRVVVELPCEASPALEVACLASSLIALVTETAPAALRQGRCTVELLADWSVPSERVVAVAVHRSGERIADPASIGAVLGCPVVAILPPLDVVPGAESSHLDPLLQSVGRVLDKGPGRATRSQVSP